MSAPFVGRERELGELAELAAQYRLITIVGPAGIGKTRLARQLVARCGGRVCDLSEAESVEAMCEAVRRALDPHARDADRAIAATRALVVLDNLEQLLPEAATVIARWLDEARPIIATSRERLRVTDEAVLALGPLEPQAAEQLFVERARAAGMRDIPDVGPIVHALEGFPLSIELCAPRLRMLGAAELLRELERPLALLSRHARDVPLRHASLERALEASWRLLDERERAALPMLACLRGSFDAAAADAILGEPAAGVLEALCERSLLCPSDGRFRMYLAVRSFAESQAPERWREACVRHARWFAEHPGDDDNLHAVIQRALTRDEIVGFAARAALALHERRRRLDPAVLERLARAVPQHGVALKRARAETLYERGQYRESLVELDGALALGPTVLETALLEEGRCSALVRLRRFEDARVAGEHALAGYESEQHPRALVALGALAMIDVERGELSRALESYCRVHERALLAGDARHAAMATGFIGHVRHEQGDLEQAIDSYRAARLAFGELGDARLAAVFEGYEGCARHEAGALDDAEQHYASACTVLEGIQAHPFAGLFHACLASLHAARQRVAEAEAELARAASLVRAADDPSLAAALVIHQQQLRLATARSDLESPRWRERHAQVLSDLPFPQGTSDDARFAWRLWRRARDELRRAAEQQGVVRPRIRMGDSWIETAAARVDLASRKVLWRVLEALVRARLHHPGKAVTREELLRAGWGDERIQPAAAAHRLRVALSELRTKALGEALERASEGYRIAPDVDVEYPAI